MIDLDDRTVDRKTEALVAALTDPIIVFDPGWPLPDWLKGEIKLQRLAQAMTGEDGVATDAEALAYVSNASLCVPLSREWVDIYSYLLTSVMGEKVPEELRKGSLDDWQGHLLGELKEWLWQQRIKAREEGARQERAGKRAEAKARAPKQLSLF